MVYQIIYISKSIEHMSATQISEILQVSRSNNLRDDISGLLMYYDKFFFQVLEGKRSAVEFCFSRIKLDIRHTQTTAIWKSDVEDRVFPDWAMGTADPYELGQKGQDSLVSLAKLKNDKGSVLTGDSVAAKLAHWVLRDFSHVQ